MLQLSFKPERVYYRVPTVPVRTPDFCNNPTINQPVIFELVKHILRRVMDVDFDHGAIHILHSQLLREAPDEQCFDRVD